MRDRLYAPGEGDLADYARAIVEAIDTGATMITNALEAIADFLAGIYGEKPAPPERPEFEGHE